MDGFGKGKTRKRHQMRYTIASSRSTASSFSDPLHQEKLRALKAAGTYNVFIFSMPCGAPQDPLAGHLTFPFYNGYWY